MFKFPRIVLPASYRLLLDVFIVRPNLGFIIDRPVTLTYYIMVSEITYLIHSVKFLRTKYFDYEFSIAGNFNLPSQGLSMNLIFVLP